MLNYMEMMMNMITEIEEEEEINNLKDIKMKKSMLRKKKNQKYHYK